MTLPFSRKAATWLDIIIVGVACFSVLPLDARVPTNQTEDSEGIMSDAYWKVWSAEVQQKIDADIEANRKADATVQVGAIADGSEVVVEQVTSSYFFGAHIFNFDQLGDTALNEKYKSLYGTLFNSATVAFYWAPLEMERGNVRLKGEHWDTPDFWNSAKEPKTQLHWRRPATDPVVDYLKERDVRVLGHPLIWGSRSWQIPAWMFDACLEGEEKVAFDKLVAKYNVYGVKSQKEFYNDAYRSLSAQQLDEMFPKFAENLKTLFRNRIVQLGEYYGDKIDIWDVCNESAVDYERNLMNVGGKLAKSSYGIMPADYTFEAFKVADEVFPKSVKFSINDYKSDKHYAKQVKELLERGSRIDSLGVQMHLFNASRIKELAAGKGARKLCTPNDFWGTMKRLDVGLPIHMSEITISAPDDTLNGRMMQAIIARNLYRLWFSAKQTEGITWWNVVDDCGAPGEPSRSGIFTRSMNPKPAFHALNDLINGEWRTSLMLQPDGDGNINFRGFRGKYRISWTDAAGKEQFMFHEVK